MGSASAFGPFSKAPAPASFQPAAALIDTLPGALAPVGFFDPLGFAAKATDDTVARYREAELAHGRVAMLAVIGFLVGEKVEGSSFLFDAQISGPAITHITQVPVDQAGLLKEDYLPGDLKFDPLGLKPEEPEEFMIIKPKNFNMDVLQCLLPQDFWHKKQ